MARLILLLLFLLPTPVLAQPVRVEAVEIIDFGVYRSKTDNLEKDPNAPIGYVSRGSGYRLLERGDEFCAKINLEFGVEYRISGPSRGASVAIDMITKFPPAGMTNRAGRWFAQSEYKSQLIIGETSARTYIFEEPWEMVPGLWTFEFHHLGRKIGEKQFKILPSCPIS